MPKNPELDDFILRTQKLLSHPVLKKRVKGDEVSLARLSVSDVEELCKDEAGYYFLIAAAGLNRTTLKRASEGPEAQIVEARLRRSHAIRQHLPVTASFRALSVSSAASRERDLARKRQAGAEGLLKQRLAAEGIPIHMSPPVRQVPGLLVKQRKPDGVFPDPETGLAPRIYLEIKNIRRVSDDIQKRLYEIAEVSLEMKVLYGRLQLRGFDLKQTGDVLANPRLRPALRKQIRAARPVVVAFFVCPRAQAERYREGAEAFIDRVFFQEEVEDCIEFLRATINELE